MKIINYLYIKYSFAFLISISSSLAIFFIFTLIGNLGEKINFSSIIYLSFLSSIQILSYVNSFIIFLSFIIFVIILKSKNEIIIVKEYLSSNRIIAFFLPLVLIFTFLEIEKENISKQINAHKSNLLKSNYKNENKIIVDIFNDSKQFTVIEGLNLENSKIEEIQRYKIINNEVVEAEYSNDLIILNDEIISNKLTKFDSEKVIMINESSKILKSLNEYDTKQIVFYKNQKNSVLNFNINLIYVFLYYSIFYLSLILIILHKHVVDKKNNFVKNVSLGIFLLIYSMSINSIVLSNFNFELNILSIFFITLIFTKYFKYE